MTSSLQFTVHGLQFTMAGAAAIEHCKPKTENSWKNENCKLLTEVTGGSV